MVVGSSTLDVFADKIVAKLLESFNYSEIAMNLEYAVHTDRGNKVWFGFMSYGEVLQYPYFDDLSKKQNTIIRQKVGQKILTALGGRYKNIAYFAYLCNTQDFVSWIMLQFNVNEVRKQGDVIEAHVIVDILQVLVIWSIFSWLSPFVATSWKELREVLVNILYQVLDVYCMPALASDSSVFLNIARQICCDLREKVDKWTNTRAKKGRLSIKSYPLNIENAKFPFQDKAWFKGHKFAEIVKELEDNISLELEKFEVELSSKGGIYIYSVRIIANNCICTYI